MESILTIKLPRFLYAITFAGFGLMHFLNGTELVNTVPDFLPGKMFWVYFTGFAMITASISFLIEKYIRLAALLTALLMLVYILTIHIPHFFKTGTYTALAGFFLALAIAGGALLLAGQYPSKKTWSQF